MGSDARRLLAEFFLREAQGARSAHAYAVKRKLSPKAVNRAINCETDLGLDSLQEFADALGLEPWNLLFPGFKRGSPPFPSWSDEAFDVAVQLDKIADEATRKRAYAAIVKLLEAIAPPPAGPAAPAATTAPAPAPKPLPSRRR